MSLHLKVHERSSERRLVYSFHQGPRQFVEGYSVFLCLVRSLRGAGGWWGGVCVCLDPSRLISSGTYRLGLWIFRRTSVSRVSRVRNMVWPVLRDIADNDSGYIYVLERVELRLVRKRCETWGVTKIELEDLFERWNSDSEERFGGK